MHLCLTNHEDELSEELLSHPLVDLQVRCTVGTVNRKIEVRTPNL